MCNNEIIRINTDNKKVLDKIRIKLQEKVGKRIKITYNDTISYLTGENITFTPESPYEKQFFFFYGTPRDVMWESKGMLSLQIFKYNGKNGIIGENYVRTKKT